jgi:hypothetical protein
MVAAVGASAAVSLVACPTELLKCRLQAQGCAATARARLVAAGADMSKVGAWGWLCGGLGTWVVVCSAGCCCAHNSKVGGAVGCAGLCAQLSGMVVKMDDAVGRSVAWGATDTQDRPLPCLHPHSQPNAHSHSAACHCTNNSYMQISSPPHPPPRPPPPRPTFISRAVSRSSCT